MPVVFDLAALPPGERAEALHSVVTDSRSVRVRISHDVASEQIAGAGSVAEVGGLSVFSAQSSPLVISRTARLARDDFEPSLVLGMQLSGSSVIAQDGRDAVMRPGDMNLVDTTRPYLSVNPSGANHHYIRIPRARLALPDQALRDVTAARLPREDPVVSLVWGLFRALAEQSVPLAAVPGTAGVESPAVELVRTLICHRTGQEAAGREPAAHTLALRVMSYVQDHLGDADLCAASIARAHHVSVRQLYAVLAKADITLGQWIRARRLEACRRDLAGQEGRRLTIAAIARRWGFRDATHFGRAFKGAYGMSPREWRELHRGS